MYIAGKENNMSHVSKTKHCDWSLFVSNKMYLGTHFIRQALINHLILLLYRGSSIIGTRVSKKFFPVIEIPIIEEIF